MAPLKVCCLGWRDTHQILLTNSGSRFESWPRHISQGTDYVAVSEVAVALARAECHYAGVQEDALRSCPLAECHKSRG